MTQGQHPDFTEVYTDKEVKNTANQQVLLSGRKYFLSLLHNNRDMRFESFTPRISKHYLLFVAALVWTFAGGMLEYKGYSFLMVNPHFIVVRLIGCLIGGALFFRLLFSKISGKHVARIINLPIKYPCLFSFFNWRSYLMMGIMISSGIILRKTGAVPPQYLSLIYITMGIPLLMSSFRFYYSFFKS